MGADEKHAATYHGGEYTPSVRDLRICYVALRDQENTSLAEVREEFQRGIDRIRAEAWAEGHAAGEGSVKAKDNPYKENP